MAVLSPRAPVSHGAARALGIDRLLFRFVANTVKKSLSRLHWSGTPLVSWVYNPAQWAIPGLIGECLAIYECYDQHCAVDHVTGGRSRASRDERRLLSAVDAVIATSEPLVEDKARFHAQVLHMPNAADVQFFSRVQGPSVKVAPDVADLTGWPVVGYLGTIGKGTDLPLLVRIATSRPDWRVLLVGPVLGGEHSHHMEFFQLKNMPNVRHTGWVDKESLLGYCKAFDVGVIPYRLDSEFNAFVTPNKLFEYLAMGLPVVSADLPGLGDYKKYAWVARTPQQFIQKIEAALTGIRPSPPALEDISWDTRADAVAQFVSRLLDSPTRGRG